LVVTGTVRDENGKPVANKVMDWWQPDENGHYSVFGYHCRGKCITNDKGEYSIETIVPGNFGISPTFANLVDFLSFGIIKKLVHKKFGPEIGLNRPAHLHVFVEDFTTQIYMPNDPYMKSDPVFFFSQGDLPVKLPKNILQYKEAKIGNETRCTGEFNFVLPPAK